MSEKSIGDHTTLKNDELYSDKTMNLLNYTGSQSAPKNYNDEQSDTAEDATTDTFSKGKLKHEMRMLKTKYIENSNILENSQLLSRARETELLETINTLTCRLNLVNSRYDAMIQSQKNSNEIKSGLTEILLKEKLVSEENDKLHNELKSVRQFLLNIPVTLSAQDGTETEMYKLLHLTQGELHELKLVPSESLPTLGLLKLMFYRIFKFHYPNPSGSQPKNSNYESVNRQENGGQLPKNVHFVDPYTQSNTSADSDLSNSYKNLDPSLPQTFVTHQSHEMELTVAKQQLDLLKADKEYLLKQITQLKSQLTLAEENLVNERKRVVQLETEQMRVQDTMDANQKEMTSNFEQRLQNQATQLTEMLQSELDRLKNFDQQIHAKELAILKEQRDQAIFKCELVESQLEQTQIALNTCKQELLTIKSNMVTRCKDQTGLEVDLPPVRKQLTRLTIELEAARCAKRDAQNQIEKLATQLDVSKKTYYEMENRLNQEKKELEHKLRETEQKLTNQKILENEIDSLMEKLTIIDLPQSAYYPLPIGSERDHDSVILQQQQLSSSRRSEQSLRLAKQFTDLKFKCERLEKERDEMAKEASIAQDKANRYSNMISRMGQPTDCLVTALSQRDDELGLLRTRLKEAQSEIVKLIDERNKLAKERNELAQDLERVLTRRQNLSTLRQQIMWLVDQTPRLSKSTKFNQPVNSTTHWTSNYGDHSTNKTVNFQQQVYDILRSQ